jgi:hypothetical protein
MDVPAYFAANDVAEIAARRAGGRHEAAGASRRGVETAERSVFDVFDQTADQ